MSAPILSAAVDFSVGSLLRYIALILACIVAIESVAERRFLRIALIGQTIEMLPMAVAWAIGMPLAPGAIFLAAALAAIVPIPLLVVWSGFDTGRAIYIAVVAFIFVLLFSTLALA